MGGNVGYCNCVPEAYMSPLFLIAGGGGWVYRVAQAYTGVGNHTNGVSS